MPIQCTNDGCTDEFANEKELLHHQFVGKCHFEIEFKSSANSDITKKIPVIDCMEHKLCNNT
jgi:hypothetical protein